MTKHSFKYLGSVGSAPRIDGEESDVIAYQFKGNRMVYIRRITNYNTWLFASTTKDGESLILPEGFKTIDQVYNWIYPEAK